MLRLATPDDAEGVLAIYAPVVLDTYFTYELVPPSVDEMRARIERVIPDFPWLVDESERGVDGYAYASRHHERAGYRWSADVSVYVSADARGKGVGRRLYAALLEILRDLEYVSAFAGIALPNDGSVGLHEAMSFTPVGVYRSPGYKLGAWHDVGWWQLALRDPPADPPEPIPMREYLGDARLARRLAGQCPA